MSAFRIVMRFHCKYLAPDHVLDTCGCICELVVLAILLGYLLAKPPVVELKEKCGLPGLELRMRPMSVT